MPFDPHRDVSVVSGPFSVDVNELCAEHTILTYKKLFIIEPARGALTTALWEAEAATPANPLAGTALVDAIRRALAALDALESHIDELLWKLQDASLTYGDAEAGASLWEVVPGSPMGPQLTRSAWPGSMPREASRARRRAPSFMGSRTWHMTWGFPGCRRYSTLQRHRLWEKGI